MCIALTIDYHCFYKQIYLLDAEHTDKCNIAHGVLTTGMRDPLSDLSLFSDLERNGGGLLGDSPANRLSTSSSQYTVSRTPSQPLLLTPEAFTSTRYILFDAFVFMYCS